MNGDSSAMHDEEIKIEIEEQPIAEHHTDYNDEADVNGDIAQHIEHIELNDGHDDDPAGDNDMDGLNEEPPIIHILKKPSHFQYSKQHTGLKNISFNVGAAVSPTDKMEFDQEKPESFGLLKINRPIGKAHTIIDRIENVAKNLSPTSTEGLTDQGYFDLKFHHNKLW